MEIIYIVQGIVTIFFTILFYEIFKKIYLELQLKNQINNGTAYRVKDDESSMVIRGTKEFIAKMKEKYPNE